MEGRGGGGLIQGGGVLFVSILSLTKRKFDNIQRKDRDLFSSNHWVLYGAHKLIENYMMINYF